MSLPPPKLTRVTSGRSVVLNHRESLTMLNDNKTPAAPQPLDAYIAAYPNIPVDENSDDGSTYDGWMSQFCKEPGDWKALAEAIFVPCVLYGKIEWRRARLARGQSADDSAWRAKDGCNGMCWAYYIVMHFHPFHAVMLCFERAAVRGKYGIKGDMGTDCAMSYFCERCTLVNMDREIRAREGLMKLRNSKGYEKYLRQQGIETEQPGLNPPMAYMSPRPTQDQPSGKSPQQVPSNARPEMSQSGPSNPITRPTMAAVKKPGKSQKAQRRSKLSSAYLTPSDDDGEELLPLGKGKQRTMGANGNEGVLSPHSLENCEVTFVDIPLTQHDLGNCAKSTTLPASTSQHELKHCDTANLVLGLVQHELAKCQVSTSPARRAQHPLTQCENVAIDDDATSQHGLEQCQTTTGGSPKRQHILEQCQLTTINAPQKQHNLDQCESTSSNVSQKQHQLGQCVVTLPKMTFSQTPFDVSLPAASETPKNHTLAVCEDSKVKNTNPDDSSDRRDSYPQHVLADCPVEVPGGKHYQTISGPSNKDKTTQSYRHRLSSCPASSPDSSSEDQKGTHHVAENAQISTGGSLENVELIKAGVAAIRQEEMRQTRNDVKRLATSQTMPTINTSDTIPSDGQSRRQNHGTQPRVTSKGKQKSRGVNEAKAAIDEYRTAEHSAQLSLAKFLESKGNTVGHASSQHQAGILEAAARAGRHTRSDDGIADDSDYEDSLAGSGNVQEEERSQSGRSTWFARVASPFRGKE